MPHQYPASTSQADSAICTLCAIGCRVNDCLTSRCTRRARWSPPNPNRSRDAMHHELARGAQLIASVALDEGSLIWLDSCDVQTTRAAVAAAKRTGATIHVGQSPGSVAVKSAMFGGAWFGSTLAEVPARAEVIVTFGDGLLSEAPLLADRFFRTPERPAAYSPAAYWIHISAHEVVQRESTLLEPNETLHWPRELWFERLSRLALSIQSNSTLLNEDVNEDANADEVAIHELATRLKGAQQTVWIWDVDEFHFQTDELLVRRLVSIASELNSVARCSLLPLDMNIGRVTAEETLLWLTGCAGTAAWRGGRWTNSHRFAGFTLDQWSAAFRSIVLVSNLPSDRSLPNLPAALILQARESSADNSVQVAAAGLVYAAHLFRGDRGIVHFAPALQATELPMAAAILNQLGNASHAVNAAEVNRAH